MTEQELRALVHHAIARHAGTLAASAPSHFAPSDAPPHLARSAPSHQLSQAAFGLFVVPSGADDEGPCIIEPSVPCNHCGYCKSMGH